MHGQWARRYSVTMHRKGGLVEARHHHKHHVFSALHICATDFFLKMSYVSSDFFFYLWWQMLPQAVKNINNHISPCGQ